MIKTKEIINTSFRSFFALTQPPLSLSLTLYLSLSLSLLLSDHKTVVYDRLHRSFFFLLFLLMLLLLVCGYLPQIAVFLLKYIIRGISAYLHTRNTVSIVVVVEFWWDQSNALAFITQIIDISEHWLWSALLTYVFRRPPKKRANFNQIWFHLISGILINSNLPTKQIEKKRSIHTICRMKWRRNIHRIRRKRRRKIRWKHWELTLRSSSNKWRAVEVFTRINMNAKIFSFRAA